MIHIRTIIGFASRKANTGPAHGQALGDDEVAYVKEQLGFNPSEKYHVPEKAREYFTGCVDKGQKLEQEWNEKFEQYSQKYPEEAEELKARMKGGFVGGDNIADLLPSKSELPTAEQPTRKSSGIAVQALVPKYKNFVAGSADLLESTFVNFKGQVEFQKVRSSFDKWCLRECTEGPHYSHRLVWETTLVVKSVTESESSRWSPSQMEWLRIRRACSFRELIVSFISKLLLTFYDLQHCLYLLHVLAVCRSGCTNVGASGFALHWDCHP